jgi:mannose-6-phosphate isomerase-like protein (cupin superfamily)
MARETLPGYWRLAGDLPFPVVFSRVMVFRLLQQLSKLFIGKIPLLLTSKLSLLACTTLMNVTKHCNCHHCIAHGAILPSYLNSRRISYLKTTYMKGFKTDVKFTALKNKNFRKVLYTSNHLQLVVMSLRPGEDIGPETHHHNDQFFRIEEGKAKCTIDKTEYEAHTGDVIIVPAGAKHNIINADKTTELKLCTIYSPPHHRDGIIHATKTVAEHSSEVFDGKTTEPAVTTYSD